MSNPERTLEEIAEAIREIAGEIGTAGTAAARLRQCADEIDRIDVQQSMDVAMESGIPIDPRRPILPRKRAR